MSDKKTAAPADPRDGLDHDQPANYRAAAPDGQPASAEPLVPDTDQAIAFLKAVYTDGFWMLTAIEPDGPGIETVTFLPTEEAKARLWIDSYNGRWNLYWAVNQPIKALSKKARKNAIRAVHFLHVDIDPRLDETVGEAQDRIKKRLMVDLPEGVPPPSCIIGSGGGLQALWTLSEPVTVNGDEALAQEVERYNRWLEVAFGADECHDVSRVLRLPGTINCPNAKKRAKGRLPALAHLVEHDPARVYPESAFGKAPSKAGGKAGPAPGPEVEIPDGLVKVDLDDLPATVTQRIKAIIVQGDDVDRPYNDRSRAVWAVTCALMGAGVADDIAASILLDPDFGISAHVREQRRPKDYAARQIRRAKDQVVHPEFCEINDTYAVVIVGDKTAILKEGLSDEGKPSFSFLSKDAFNTWLANRMIETGKDEDGDPIMVPLAKFWMTHPRRRQYEGVRFTPGHESPNYYNLWRGFAVDPKPGACSLFLAHILDNVCQGDEKLFRWVIGWWAQIFQRPDKKVDTSLVIRGKEGTGKTKVGEVFGSLLGDHYLAVSDPRYITGNFNSHMVSCILLHAEEAFWAGDHKAEGRLKDLVSGKRHLIEFKGKEPIYVRNFIRLFVTGNPDWVVPVSLEGRRFAVLEIGEKRMRDGPYFAAIDHEMDNGGREALLRYLPDFDLSTVNLRAVPKTTALLEQKIASLTPEQSWWLDVLGQGRLPYGCVLQGECPTAALFDHYLNHAKETGAKRRSIETRLGQFLQKAVPGLTKRDTKYNRLDKGGFVVKERGLVYEFPDLKTCREAFEALLEQDLKWDDLPGWLMPDSDPDCPC